MRVSTKFFPWSPGIPWRIKNGKYVLPELPATAFHSALKGKDIVVCSFGGFLEAFYSMSILEILNYEMPGAKIKWCGDKEYHSLIKANGIAKTVGLISKADVERFPTPIFFDKNNRVYINALYNYLDVKSYYLTNGYRNQRAAIRQIVENATIPWDDRFLPQLRNLEKPKGLDSFLQMHRINLNKPFALVLPDPTGCSEHEETGLNWDIHETKSFAAMMNQSSVPVVVLSENSTTWTYSQAKTVPFRPDFALYLMIRAGFILSRDIDFNVVASAVADGIVLTDKVDGALSPKKNNKFLGYKNVIYTKEGLSPVEAWKFIAGKGCA